MIVSVHLADVGPLMAQRLLFTRVHPERIAGMAYAESALAVHLGRRPPLPQLGRIGLIAAWDNDTALDRFLGEHPLAQRLSDGWHVRLEPLRCFGSWVEMPGLPDRERSVSDDEPVAVLTLGRHRLLRLRPFLKASAPAEREAVDHPAAVAVTGLGRPALPRLASTFSIWRSAAEMRRYAFGDSGAHQAAVKADRRRPFHHESAFIRFRPYASHGKWDGRDPVAGLTPASATTT